MTSNLGSQRIQELAGQVALLGIEAVLVPVPPEGEPLVVRPGQAFVGVVFPVLNHWRRRFFERLDEVRALGYSETFIRMWEYYLCYCEGGFIERNIGDVHMLLTKPDCRRAPLGF